MMAIKWLINIVDMKYVKLNTLLMKDMKNPVKKISRGLLDTSSQKLEEQRKKLIENKIDNQEVEDDEKQDKKEENTNVFVSHLNRVIPALDRHLVLIRNLNISLLKIMSWN